MVAKKPLLRLLLQAFGFAVCVIIGVLFSTLTDETWLFAVGIGIDMIICSAIGAYIETKKPHFLYYLLFRV